MLAAAITAAAGCGGGGGGGGGPAPPEPTVITGRIVEQVGPDEFAGIEDVRVIFGNQSPGPIEDYTDTDGNFSLVIPYGTLVIELFQPTNQNFEVDGTPAGIDILLVEFEGDPNSYDPTSIPVPVSVLTGASTDLGTLIVAAVPPPPL